MQVDADLLQTEDAYTTEQFEILMVKDTEGFDMEVEKGEKISAVVNVEMHMVYPQADEGLTDFLERCKLSDSKTMLFPRCSIVFDEEETKKLRDTRVQDPRRSRGRNQASRFTLDKKRWHS